MRTTSAMWHGTPLTWEKGLEAKPFLSMQLVISCMRGQTWSWIWAGYIHGYILSWLLSCLSASVLMHTLCHFVPLTSLTRRGFSIPLHALLIWPFQLLLLFWPYNSMGAGLGLY